MNSFIFMCFLSIKKYSKILRIKIKSVYVKDFLISTKVRLKRMEHLHQKEIFSWDPYFRDSIANNFVMYVYCRCLQILYQITFFIRSKVISYHNGLLTLKTYHDDSMGYLHEFFHHSAIISCITFHLLKYVDCYFLNKVYRYVLRFLLVHTKTCTIYLWNWGIQTMYSMQRLFFRKSF